MSKRFEVLFYGDVINCVRDENGKEYNLHELISILMEQQATIQSLQTELELVSGAKLFSRRELERKVKEQQATIEMYQRRVDKREEQISIIKKYCIKFLTDEQFETIRKELENE